MTDIEILRRYRYLAMEADIMQRQASALMSIGGPRDVHGVQLTGMPRGTNMSEAAAMQALDGYAERLRAAAVELARVIGRFEDIIQGVADDRDRVILRMYYALGYTDERIAAELELETRTVNGLRNERVRSLE